jgi:predicted Zn-dependent protease
MNEPNEIYVVLEEEESEMDGLKYRYVNKNYGFWLNKEKAQEFVNKLNGELTKASWQPYYFLGVLNNALTLK